MATETAGRVVKDATCTFCGCVCDDIDLTVEGNRITKAKNACVLGKAWFFENRSDEARPEAYVEGRPTTADEAISEAARILATSRYPIVYGLSDTTAEAQRAAVELADLIGACLDTTTSVCHGPSGIAFQAVGEATCTLGEIKNRADMVIFWGGNPAESHPRHFTKYSVTPKGMFIPNGRKDRYVVVVDVRRTLSARAADLFLQIKPRKDFELLWALRALVKGVEVDPGIEAETGIPLTTLRGLVDRMKRAKFGVFLFGMGLSMTRGKHYNAAAILVLARDLNRYTRFLAKPMRGHCNVTGADNVVSWSTGYPFGVNLGRGYPRFNPGEFTTVDVLNRGEADAALIISADPAANFPQPAIDHLKQIPTVVLDPQRSETAKIARVAFTTAVYGINVAGTVYRMDDVPIRLRPAFPSRYRSDEEILRAIATRVRALRAEGEPAGATP
jgi:formylmethanofuran dehydrogenase subunit B